MTVEWELQTVSPKGPNPLPGVRLSGGKAGFQLPGLSFWKGMTMTVAVGDEIRVQDWPGTYGKRFVVESIEVSKKTGDQVVFALDKEHRMRAFPMDQCKPAGKRASAVKTN